MLWKQIKRIEMMGGKRFQLKGRVRAEMWRQGMWFILKNQEAQRVVHSVLCGILKYYCT